MSPPLNYKETSHVKLSEFLIKRLPEKMCVFNSVHIRPDLRCNLCRELLIGIVGQAGVFL